MLPTEKALLAWMMLPARITAELIKSEWRRQRNQSLEELGLPPLSDPRRDES